jgi:O-antigen polysaccharide polymerase Wzy
MTIYPLHRISTNRHYKRGDSATARTIVAARERLPPKSTLALILTIDGTILTLLALAGLIYDYGRLSPGPLFQPASIVISTLVIWWYWSWRSLAGRWFDPYTLFLTAAVLFNCGQPLLEVFGLNNLRDHFSEEVSLAMLYLIAFGMSAFHFAVLLSTALRFSKCPQTSNKNTFSESHLRNIYLVGVLLLLISAVPEILTLRDRLEAVMAGGYMALYSSQLPTGLAGAMYTLSDLFIPGIALVIAGGKRHPIVRFCSLLSIFIWSGTEFFLGGRSHALMPAVGILWLWDRTVSPVSRTALIGGALLLISIVFPLIAVTREEVGANRLSLNHLQNAYTQIGNPVVAELSEMGGTADTIGWTMELVPSERPFALGTTYLSAMLTLVPNIFSSGVHPALSLFGYDIPGNWLVQEISPYDAAHGGSFGYSYIAEAYLNFGWAAPLALFVMGFLYGQGRKWTLNSNDPAKMAVMGIFLTSILFFARSSLITAVRPLVWYALFPYLVIRMLDWWSARKQIMLSTRARLHQFYGCSRP